MARSRKRRGLLSLAILLVWASLVIYWNYSDDEMNVYIALLNEQNMIAEMGDVAFMSVVSTCQLEHGGSNTMMASALIKANSNQRGPIRLEKLTSLANVVNAQETTRFHQQKTWSTSLKWAGNRIVRLSRVGFNDAKDKAVLCLISGHSAHMVYFERQNWRRWAVTQFSPLWVSEWPAVETIPAQA